MTSRHEALACIFAAVTLGLSAGQALGEPSAEWDQARVTGIAAKLAAATEALYTALLDEGPMDTMPGAFGAGDAYNEFKDKVRLMHSESMHVADELKKGAGRDQTKHAFQRISELNRDAAEMGRAQFTENPVVSKFSPVEDLLRQLDPYYGS